MHSHAACPCCLLVFDHVPRKCVTLAPSSHSLPLPLPTHTPTHTHPIPHPGYHRCTTPCSNFYFQILVAGNQSWSPALGPGGKYQWSSPQSPGTMMLTSDIGLLRDPRGIYPSLVQMYV